MQKFILVLAVVLSSFSVFAQAPKPDYAQHPEPHDPLYIESSWYNELKAQIPPPPAAKSAEQTADEQVMLERQKTRVEKDCTRAGSEVLVGLNSFYGTPNGFLTEAQVSILSAFFGQVRNDTSFFVMKIKKEYNRNRPFITLTQLTPCIPKEPSTSYPSGHAAIAAVYAMILEDLYPEQKDVIEARALQIAQDRVLGGVHYPTDIAEGREIAKLVYAKMTQSVRFKTELSMLRKKIK